MISDFHTHTSLSDGELSPLELIRRAVQQGYRAIGITDHAGPGEMDRLIKEITIDCALAQKYWNIKAIPGVELTHLPAHAIADVARQAKEAGAKLVVVHGETISEPVEKGTNAAATRCPDVDILAHPGFVTLEEAKQARENGVFLEVSARKAHSLTNGHIVKTALATGAKLLLGSDAHDEGDLLSAGFAHAVLSGAGLSDAQIKEVLETNSNALLGLI